MAKELIADMSGTELALLAAGIRLQLDAFVPQAQSGGFLKRDADNAMADLCILHALKARLT